MKKNPNGSVPGNAIKLLKENESRETLVIARRYLQEYGSRVMKVNVGKRRDELPPYVIHDDIPADTLQRIQQNIDAIVYQEGEKIENLNDSIMQQNSGPHDYSSGSSVMTSISQSYDMSESAPPSPYTACSSIEIDDDISCSSGVSGASIVSFVRERSLGIGNRDNRPKNNSSSQQFKEEKKEDVVTPNDHDLGNTPKRAKPDLNIPGNISPLVAHTPLKSKQLDVEMTLSLSPSDTKRPSNDDDASPSSVADAVDINFLKAKDEKKIDSSLDRTIEVRLHQFDMEKESLTDLIGDDQSIGSTEEKRIASLTDEEINAIEDIAMFKSSYKTENKQILSIANGDPEENKNESGNLFRKLNNLACKKLVKSEEKDDNKCDERTVVTASSHSHIRIKDSDGLTLGGSVSTRRRHLRNAFKHSRPEKGSLSPEGKLKLGNGVQGVDVGLKLFFAIFVVTYNFGDDSFNDVQRKSAIPDDGLIVDGPLVPVEIVYKLWAAMLRSERSFEKVDGRKIYQAFVDATKANGDGGQSASDKSLLSSLEKNDLCICRFIVNHLQSSGCVSLSNIALELNQSSAISKGVRSQKRLVMGIRNEESLSLGVLLARESLEIQYERNISVGDIKQYCAEDLNVEKLRKQCHSIISRSLLENVDLDSTDGMFIDQHVDFDLLSTWYIMRWLPYHLLSADMGEIAVKLLVDKRFVQARLQSNGLHFGTMQFISDCGVIHSLSNKDSEVQSFVTEDGHGMKAVVAVYDAVRSYLSETKKTFSLSIPKNAEQSFCDLAGALHDLAIAIGDTEEGFRSEIDILGEALRFRIAGSADKLLIVETQLQLGSCYHAVGDLTNAITSYDDALQLTINVHGSNYSGLSKILYHMGVLYCEENQHDPALGCFVRALKISESQGDTENGQSEDICKIYSWIGNVHRERGDSELALSYFEKALQTMTTRTDEECLETAEILQNIGIVQDDLGKDELSLRALYKCLEIRRKLLRSDFHHDVCETIGCIANVYRKTDVDKALRLFRIVLNSRAKESVDSDADEGLLGYYEDMLDVAKVKLEMSVEPNNDLHIEIATLYFKIGALLEKRGRYTNAIENYLRALKVRQLFYCRNCRHFFVRIIL